MQKTTKTRVREFFQGGLAGGVAGYSTGLLIDGDIGMGLLGLFLGISGLYTNFRFVKANVICETLDAIDDTEHVEKLKKEKQDAEGN